MLGLSVANWCEIRRTAQDVEKSDFAFALKSVFHQRMESAFATLINLNSTESEIRCAQGRYIAHKRDIMIIEDLIRMADSVGKQEKANARRTDT